MQLFLKSDVNSEKDARSHLYRDCPNQHRG